MLRSPALRIGLGVLLAIVALGILRARPWHRPEAPANPTRKELEVAYLPVT